MGVISISIDFIVYNISQFIFGISMSTSKILSFICGAINSFIMNKKITFKSKNNGFSEPLKFIILYIISLYFNSTTHDYFLRYDVNYLPFISATIVSIIINFSGQKFWVFKKGSF